MLALFSASFYCVAATAMLAQSAPPPLSGEWQSNLISFSILAYIALSIWEKVKRKPALEETFATKKSTDEADQRLQAALDKLDDRTRAEITALDGRMQKSIQAMNEIGEKRAQANRDLIQEKVAGLEKSIGDKIHDNRENTSERFGELRGQMASFQTSLQGLSNDLMHQVGRLEGRSDANLKVRDE